MTKPTKKKHQIHIWQRNVLGEPECSICGFNLFMAEMEQRKKLKIQEEINYQQDQLDQMKDEL